MSGGGEEGRAGQSAGQASLLLQLPTAFVMNDDGKSGSSISAQLGRQKFKMKWVACSSGSRGSRERGA